MVFSESTAHGSYVFMPDNFQERTTPEIGPYFDTTMSTNVTGLAGETVQLACKVKNRGNRTVSTLTVNFFSYIEFL